MCNIIKHKSTSSYLLYINFTVNTRFITMVHSFYCKYSSIFWNFQPHPTIQLLHKTFTCKSSAHLFLLFSCAKLYQDLILFPLLIYIFIISLRLLSIIHNFSSENSRKIYQQISKQDFTCEDFIWQITTSEWVFEFCCFNRKNITSLYILNVLWDASHEKTTKY